jgi:hypothetical protein
VVLLSAAGQMPGINMELGKGSFIQHSFQFIIHRYPITLLLAQGE